MPYDLGQLGNVRGTYTNNARVVFPVNQKRPAEVTTVPVRFANGIIAVFWGNMEMKFHEEILEIKAMIG